MKKFKEIIKAQGGDDSVIEDYSKLPQASIKYEVKADKDGFIKKIDAMKVAKACKLLGAGREKKSDKIDYSAGIYLTQKYDEPVKSGETIAVLYTNSEKALNEAEKLVLGAYEICKKPAKYESLIYKIIN